MRWGILFVLIFFLSNISALCNETQIDINSASLQELDKIIWIGNATAQKVIDARPFSSLDDLRKVSGLGGTGAKVEDIKSQGLACVANEEIAATNESGVASKSSEDGIFIDESEGANASGSKSTGKAVESADIISVENAADIDEINSPEIINLTPKDIKSDKSFLKTGGSNAAFYWLGIFGIFLAFLFALKRYRMGKNEF